MINEATAIVMMLYAFVTGATCGGILLFVLDWCLGFIAFHRILRFLDRIQSARDLIRPETDAHIWQEAYLRQCERFTKGND